jgi:hypothetical protein
MIDLCLDNRQQRLSGAFVRWVIKRLKRKSGAVINHELAQL